MEVHRLWCSCALAGAGLVESVTKMGFSRAEAVSALRHSQGNIQQAVDYIVSGQ